MTRRTGFGTYMNAPGLTAIEKVQVVLDRISKGSRAIVHLRRKMMAAGLDRDQAVSLVSWAVKSAEAERRKAA